MTRTILITSGKGGVGKTTLTSNLTYNLTQLGHSVTAVDANLTTPNLGLHFGLHLAPKTLHDVLKGKTKLRQATYSHPLGFKVVPAGMSIRDLLNVDVGKLPGVILNLLGKSDFVIMDSAAGLGREAVSAIQAADELLVVTNPDIPSAADALKTVNLAQKNGKKVLGVVVNRKKNRWHELRNDEIEKLVGHPVIAEIPEDVAVAKSIAVKLPVSLYEPNSPAAVEFNRLAHSLVGKKFRQPKVSREGWWSRLTQWLSR